jgi:hypothetical protein
MFFLIFLEEEAEKQRLAYALLIALRALASSA